MVESRVSFDFLAPWYAGLERVLAGPLLQRARTHWAGQLAGRRRLLVAGVGHGPGLVALLRQYPALTAVAVDASGRMLEAARARAGRAGIAPGRLEFVHARLAEWNAPAGEFDAVATHFFLDCFPADELRAVVAHLARAAARDADWLVTDFSVPATGWRRQRARAVHALMYAFFRPATGLRARHVVPPDAFLAAAGFRCRGRRRWNHGLVQADWWRRSAQEAPPSAVAGQA